VQSQWLLLRLAAALGWRKQGNKASTLAPLTPMDSSTVGTVSTAITGNQSLSTDGSALPTLRRQA
jgi:hypothetical protein